MKRALIITGIAALLVGTIRGLCGPVYRMHDACVCGRQRAWFSFDDCRALRGTHLFLTTIRPGDSQHHHRYSDATWSAQY